MLDRDEPITSQCPGKGEREIHSPIELEPERGKERDQLENCLSGIITGNRGIGSKTAFSKVNGMTFSGGYISQQIRHLSH
jgi:hypothetical protein